MKLIKELARTTSFLLVLAGLIVSMCETADWDKQFVTLLIGTLLIVAGVVVGHFVKGEEDGYCR